MWEVGEFWTHSVGLSFRNAEQLSLSKDGYLRNWKCSWLQVAISRECILIPIKNCEGSEVGPSLETNRLDYPSFMDHGRK